MHKGGMASDPAQLRSALQQFLDREGLSMDALEKAAKVGESAARKFVRGRTRSMTLRTYGLLAEGATKLLGREVTVEELQGKIELLRLPAPAGAVVPTDVPSFSVGLTSNALILSKVSLGGTGRLGGFILTDQSVGDVPRPAVLAGSRRAFAFKLLDNANAPGYRAGHVVVVDPDVGPTIDALCLFTNSASRSAGAESMVGFLIGLDAQHWRVAVGGLEHSLSRAEYPDVWPVVVHYPHGV